MRLLGVGLGVIALLTCAKTIREQLGYDDAVAAFLLGTFAVLAMHAATSEVQRFREWVVTLAKLGDACREVPASGPKTEPAHGSDCGGLMCRSVSYTAMGRERLSPLDLDVQHGEAIAVMGDADARTAFAHLVLGLLHPSAGTLMIDGIDPAQIEEAQRSSLVTGVLAGAEPFAGTILDNFRLIDPACDRVTVLDACALVHLRDWVCSLPLRELTPLSRSMLTGAVPRLLCLARLLVRLPRVLVLDGTLDELDQQHAQQIAKALDARPCTVVLCTGRPDIVPPSYRTVSVSSSSCRVERRDHV